MAKKQKTSLVHKISMRLLGAVLVCGCVFMWLSCLFYNHGDSAVNIISDTPVKNYLGIWGATAADYALSGLGLITPLFLLPVFRWGYGLVRGQIFINAGSRIFALLTGLLCGAIALALLPLKLPYLKAGGFIGTFFATQLMTAINHFNTYGYGKHILFFGCVLFTWLAFDYALGITVKHWFTLAQKIILGLIAMTMFGLKILRGFFSLFSRHHYSDEEREAVKKPKREKKSRAAKTQTERIEPSFSNDEPSVSMPDISADNEPAPTAKPEIKEKRTAKTKVPAPLKPATDDGYVRPDINLLSRPKEKTNNSVSKDELERIARDLENTLQEFGVNGKIVKVRPGPVVTLYELEPAPGTKSARVIGLADDIARSMSAAAVRIAVVQGSNTIGIELPNKTRDTVWLRDLFEDENFTNSKNDLNVVLGKDIGGQNVYADLSKMPHLLVAGTTGSGKSVGVNSMILSLLFRMSPDECKLIMIDPKMLEFSMYNGIPHLLTPVITDPAKAVIGLKWAVKEMEDRYRAMAQMNVRNISGYNQKVTEIKNSGKSCKRTVQTGFDEDGRPVYEEQEMDLRPLPYIVIVVDEMADLMLVAGKEVEAAIQRLAQMARAAGLHLIMSTQRPSVDVITGTIKANFPTRISFQVTSKIDSRTILGEQGAEQLLGKGDMLYMPAGQRPIRIHGAFVKDSEVEGIVDFIKSQKAPEYVEAVTQGELNEKDSGAVFDKGSFGGGGNEEDLYAQAVEIIRNDKKASTSYVQRKLRIGYNRAASLIDRMEDEGIVSAPDHTGRRQVIG